MSHYKYNKWLDKVEIGIRGLQWSSLAVFEGVGTKVARSSRPQLFTPRLSVSGPIQAIVSSLTFPMSYHKYNKSSYKVEIGIWGLQWSPQAVFES